MNPEFSKYLKQMPLIAILRGVKPEESIKITESLVSAGICIIEVPLNSPNPYDSIRLIAERYGDRILVGAGTVLTSEQVTQVSDVGGRLVVSPIKSIGVITKAKSLNMSCVPGAATPTEAFAALEAGADAIKAFPGEMLGPKTLSSWVSVLPENTLLLPVGGVSVKNMQPYWDAGVNGFGIGSALYQAGQSIEETSKRALAFTGEVKAFT
jgi:2-dehydro-3-deoxyphosphogalactonate aldolase